MIIQFDHDIGYCVVNVETLEVVRVFEFYNDAVEFIASKGGK